MESEIKCLQNRDQVGFAIASAVTAACMTESQAQLQIRASHPAEQKAALKNTRDSAL